MKLVESPFFRARKKHLSQEEVAYMEEEINKICDNPLLGTPRPRIKKDMSTHSYEDHEGKKILSYRYQNQKIRLVSIDRITFKV